MNKKELLEALQRAADSARHYRMLMDESMDPIFSFYADGTYRYVNSAFAQGVGKSTDMIIGKKIWDVFEKDEADRRFAVVQKVFAQGKVQEIEVRVPLPSGDTYYLTTVKPVFNADGAVETVICTSKNITKRKLAEIALKGQNDKLLKALEQIKTLSGLLPICASCKKIRDDKGYWNLLEDYIEKHSGASFSHGLCPECSEKFYGNEQWYINFKKKKE
ncbi:MAG: PAS domain S-box protein [Pseudomonadota bacterium]